MDVLNIQTAILYPGMNLRITIAQNAAKLCLKRKVKQIFYTAQTKTADTKQKTVR